MYSVAFKVAYSVTISRGQEEANIDVPMYGVYGDNEVGPPNAKKFRPGELPSGF